MPHKLKILVIHPRYCIRAAKQIEGLLSADHAEITLIIDMQKYGYRLSDHIKSKVQVHHFKFRDNFIQNYRLLKLIKKLRSNTDVIHCHNEPNYHLRVILTKFKGLVPVVYDVHDLTSMRTNREEPDEAYAFQNSDAIIHVSDKFIAFSDEKYGKGNCHTIMSLPSGSNILKNSRKLVQTPPFKFVYQGGLVDSSFEARTLTHYRDFSKIFASILEEGHSLDVFSATDTSRLPTLKEMADKYEHFRLHTPLPYKDLLVQLQEYDFGIVGFSFNYDVPSATKKYLHAALGNKLFDYLFAGIPSVVINAEAMAEFVTSNRCGAVKLDQLSWAESISKTLQVGDLHKTAQQFSMEEEIKKLIKLYQDLRQKV